MHTTKFLRAAALLAASLIMLSGLEAQEGKFLAFVDFDSQAMQVKAKIGDAEMVWLGQVFALMASHDFTFIFRQDREHWIGLYRNGQTMSLQMHDQSAPFDFRCQVDKKTGAMKVEKGVAFQGMSLEQSAEASARNAASYLKRALDAQGIFAGKGKAKAASKEAVPQKKEASSGGAQDLPPLDRLLAGNKRFASGSVLHPDQSASRRMETAKGQKPFAVVLACSDSRLSPEIIFDQGIGDLFVVRTAGEVVSEVELGSIEYAVEHLGVTHVMVLGHERCGAVDSTVKAAKEDIKKERDAEKLEQSAKAGKETAAHQEEGTEEENNIGSIIARIMPAVRAVMDARGDTVDLAVRENARRISRHLLTSPILDRLTRESEGEAKAKRLEISVAYYDIDSGEVSLLK